MEPEARDSVSSSHGRLLQAAAASSVPSSSPGELRLGALGPGAGKLRPGALGPRALCPGVGELGPGDGRPRAPVVPELVVVGPAYVEETQRERERTQICVPCFVGRKMAAVFG